MKVVEVAVERALKDERVEPTDEVVFAHAHRDMRRRAPQRELEVELLVRVLLRQFDDNDAVGGKEFRLPGTEVRVRRLGRGVLLEPMQRDPRHVRDIFAELDRLGGRDFLPEGRPEQPPMPADDDVSFD